MDLHRHYLVSVIFHSATNSTGRSALYRQMGAHRYVWRHLLHDMGRALEALQT